MADDTQLSGGADGNRIFVHVSHLNPGAILRGKTFLESGEALHAEYHVFTDTDIAALREQGTQRIYYIPVERTVSEEAKKQGITFMAKLLEALKSGGTVDTGHLGKVVDMIMEDIYPQEVGLVNLLNLKNYDEYAYVHSINVGILSMMLAKKIGMKEESVRDTGLGAFLHDVGKINTPGDIVWKMDGDTEHERKIIREHPHFGYSILKNSGNVPESAMNVVLKHHEHFDGSGYPAGLEDSEVDGGVKVVSICNNYDYYVTAVEGKAPLTPRDAMLRINRLAGTIFNPVLVNSFVREMTRHVMEKPLYPVGSVILLDTREIAVVLEIRKDSDMRPLVNIITDKNGKKLARPIRVDLRNDEKRQISQIIKTQE